MNEQGIADIFSEQVDQLLRGESPAPLAPDVEASSGEEASSDEEGLGELLTLANDLSGIGFQASPTAQAAFQNRLENWFGPTSGQIPSQPKYRRWEPMPGKLLALIVAILVTITIGAITVVISILILIRGTIPGVPPGTPTPPLTSTPPGTAVTSIPSLTSTPVSTQTVTATPVASPTIASTIDTIDVITVVITIEIEVDGLIPGLAPGDGGGGDCAGCDDDYHDHNRGHGNDPDHHDEDNPGRSRH